MLDDEDLIEWLTTLADQMPPGNDAFAADVLRDAASRLTALTTAGGFHLLDRVERCGEDSSITGTIVALFPKLDGKVRCVVQVDGCESVKGLLLIQNPAHLKRLPS